jgi:integrase
MEPKKISKITILNYENSLRQNNMTIDNLNDDYIKSRLETLGKSNQQIFISALFWKFPDLNTETKNKYREYLIKLIKENVINMEKNTKTEKQEINFIEWEDVLKIKDKIFESGKDEEKLIIALYTMIPVRRLEYCYLYKADNNDLMDDKEKNYYFEKENIGYIKFNNFKQREETQKSVTIKLPDELNKLMHDFCKNKTKFFPKNSSSTSFSHKIINMFKKYGEKRNISVQILRHSYITWIEKQNLSVRQRQILSDYMGHSFKANCMYSKKGESSDFNMDELILN